MLAVFLALTLSIASAHADPDDLPDEDLKAPIAPPRLKLNLEGAPNPEPAPSPSPTPPTRNEAPEPESKTAPLRFRTSGEPIPDGTAEGEAEEPRAVTISFDYPTFSTFVELRPGYFAINQALLSESSSPTFSYNTYLPISAQLDSSMELSPRFRLEGNLYLGYFQVSQTTLQFYEINSSSVMIASAAVTGQYCAHPSDGWQLCPGLGLGTDSFPVLQFDSNSSLSLHSYSEVILRGMVRSAHALSHDHRLIAKAGYDFGLTHSGGPGVTDASNQTLWGEVSLTSMIDRKELEFGIRVEDLKSDFLDGVDHWNSTALFYKLIVGLKL